jgi:ribosomal protein S19
LPDVEKLKNELRRKSMDIQGMTARTSEAQKKEMSKMREEVRILETRAFDPRPLSIARHEVDGSWHPFFEIDPVMIGHRLGQFAKPCYALQERFEKDLGKEYSVMKDEPQYRYVPGRDDPRYEEHDVIQAA